MAGNRNGAIKVAAGRVGLSEEAYRDRLAAGDKWCTRCRTWHPRASFDTDRSRGDGVKASCRSSLLGPRQFILRIVTARRGWQANARENDKRQCRRRINYLVESGRLPAPNSLPCADCGHVWSRDSKRHEYDHYLGYASANQLDVQAVCSRCHHRRERARG